MGEVEVGLAAVAEAREVCVLCEGFRECDDVAMTWTWACHVVLDLLLRPNLVKCAAARKFLHLRGQICAFSGPIFW